MLYNRHIKSKDILANIKAKLKSMNGFYYGTYNYFYFAVLGKKGQTKTINSFKELASEEIENVKSLKGNFVMEFSWKHQVQTFLQFVLLMLNLSPLSVFVLYFPEVYNCKAL